MRAVLGSWRCAWLLVAALASGPAWAGAGLIAVPLDDPLRCLVRPAAALAYPDGLAEAKHGALVRVRLEFTAANRPPAVEVFYNSGRRRFEEAVIEHVRAYRLPCLGAGSVRATQEFSFSHRDASQVHWSPERVDEAESGKDAEACVSLGEGKPDYPLISRISSRMPQGVVLVKIGFDGIGRAPKVDVLYDAHSPRLASAVHDHIVAQYRATCAPRGAFPFEALQAFDFQVADEKQFRLKDVGLKSFVAALKNVEPRQQVFDFNTMGCPFDVELHMFRPHANNAVGQVGGVDPNRREFVEWLKKATLRLEGAAARQLVGAPITVRVPCGTLDLS